MTEIVLTVVILGVLGLVLGVILSIVSIIMAVKKDETAEKIESVLPGANCGSCGFSGCSGYALALSKGETENTGLCSPGGAATAEKIGEILGKSGGEFVRKVAVVRCRGDMSSTETVMEYSGINSCYASNQIYKGPKACNFGCLGFGDCIAVCDYGAISIENGIAKIDAQKCGGCGKCVKECPKSVIALVDAVEASRSVLCVNHDKGAAARKACKSACLGCGKCVRVCTAGAVSVIDFAAVIDHDKCVGCGMCEDVCPSGCIKCVLPQCAVK